MVDDKARIDELAIQLIAEFGHDVGPLRDTRIRALMDQGDTARLALRALVLEAVVFRLKPGDGERVH